MSAPLIRRIDGKTGKAEWHTLHEWNIINGYEKPDEIIPVIDGEVVEEKKRKPSPPPLDVLRLTQRQQRSSYDMAKAKLADAKPFCDEQNGLNIEPG